MEPVIYVTTPSMLASQGYVSIKDLGTSLGISRAGVYALLKKITPPPKSLKVGVKVYVEVRAIVDYVKAGGVPRQRASRRRRSGFLKEMAKRAAK